MDILVDIDGVLTNEIHYDKTAYMTRTPQLNNIVAVNKLFNDGHNIILFTARLGIEDDVQITKDWLNLHGVLYTSLLFGKPNAEVYIDDKSLPTFDINLEHYLNYNFHRSCWRYKYGLVNDSESHPCFFCGYSIELKTKECIKCGIMICPKCGKCLCNIPLLTYITLVRIHEKYCCHLDQFDGDIDLDGFVDNDLIHRCKGVLINCKKLEINL